MNGLHLLGVWCQTVCAENTSPKNVMESLLSLIALLRIDSESYT